MTERGMSYQQLDPVGSYGSRPITLVLSLGIIGVAVGATVASWSAVSDPVAAVLAVVSTAISALGIVFWSSPLRAPFRWSGFVVVMFFAAVSLVLSAVATWNRSTNVVEQWAPITVGLLLVQLSSYRPALELTAATVLGGLLAAFVAVIHPMSSHFAVPPLVGVLGAALPLVALGAGATAYSSVVVRSLGRWYSKSSASDRTVSPAMKDSVVQSVQNDRVGILNDAVVPFFSGLLSRGAITHNDRAEARDIASSIRSVMVADVDRSWLDSVIDDIATERADVEAPGSEVVQDPHRLASGMSTEQRIVMRAVVIALFDHPGFDPDGFAMVITRDDGWANVTLSAKLDSDESIPRSGLAAYFAVLRIAFGDLNLSFQRPTLILRFSYEHK
jgi:hypothetical protein